MQYRASKSRPAHIGRKAQASTHASCEAQAQAFSIMPLFWLFRVAWCITISFSLHALYWLSGWSISQAFNCFHDACGVEAAASGWPCEGCTACGRFMIPAVCRHARSRPLSTRSKCFILHCKATSFALAELRSHRLSFKPEIAV